MAKTKAEIQRAYRERKKLREGENYLAKERARVKGYYVPIEERPKRKADDRRRKVRAWVKKHREMNKAQQSTDNVTNQQSDVDRPTEDMEVTSTSSSVQSTSTQDMEVTSSTDVPSSSVTPSLIVKLPNIDPKKRTRTRVSRSTAKLRRDIKRLTTEKENMNRNYKRVSKRYERLVKKTETTQSPIEHTNSRENNKSTLTPRKRTITEIREEGLSPSKLPRTIQNKLLLANVLTEEIGNAWNSSKTKGKSLVSKIVSGDVVKKYKMKKVLSIKTGIRRQNFRWSSKQIDKFPEIRKNVLGRESLRKSVVNFLERDDNSRIMPGKNDKKKTKLGHVQKRVLNDSLMFLHLKFKAETSMRVSLATFCRLRPKHIILTKFISRNKCLCQKHQNMALALKNMRTAGASITQNPDEFIRQLKDINPQEVISEIKDQKIKYEQWKKVDMADGKKRTKIVEKEMSKAEFVSTVQVQVCEFQQHVNRVRIQYQALTNLKENLPAGNAIIQMDFAENFSCCSADEVQSAYWNSSSVTLHPVVVYYRDDGGNLVHKNYVFVSDDLGHNIGTVYSFLQELVPTMKKYIKDLKKVHYWTDSPSSQYRNKTAFYIVSDHQNLFGLEATWNYFETGHGKGPCDGIGGTSKRTADLAVKQGKIVVQDAHEYYERVKIHHTSATYVFVHSEDCSKRRLELCEINKTLKPVQGTMQIHSVVGVSKGIIKSSVTSCYCSNCLEGNVHDMATSNLIKSLRNEVPVVADEEQNTDQQDTDNADTQINDKVEEVESIVDASDHENGLNETEEIDVDKSEILNYEPGQYVAVQYEKQWHVGKIMEVDESDNEYLVTFMRPSKGKTTGNQVYKWPSTEDELWVKLADILCALHEPVKVDRHGRSFVICPDDQQLMKARLPNN